MILIEKILVLVSKHEIVRKILILILKHQTEILDLVSRVEKGLSLCSDLYLSLCLRHLQWSLLPLFDIRPLPLILFRLERFQSKIQILHPTPHQPLWTLQTPSCTLKACLASHFCNFSASEKRTLQDISKIQDICQKYRIEIVKIMLMLVILKLQPTDYLDNVTM